MIQIDATILVNLPRRDDRRIKAMDDLAGHGIPFYLWMATEDKDGKKGLVKTMRSLLTYCIENDFRNVLIFEDDLKILNPYIGQLLNSCIEELPLEYDLLYLGCNMHGTPKRHSKKLLQAVGMYSSHAILYSRSAIEYILELLDDNEAYDITLVKKVQPGMQCYCVCPMLVSQHNGYSDIEGREVDYTKFLEKRFHEKTRNI